MRPERPGDTQMVQVRWRLRDKDAHIVCPKELLWHPRPWMGQRFSPNKRGANCQIQGVFPLGLKLLQLVYLHSDQEVQRVLRLQTCEASALLASLLWQWYVKN